MSIDRIKRQIEDWESEVIVAEREAQLSDMQVAIATATAAGRRAKATELRHCIARLKEML